MEEDETIENIFGFEDLSEESEANEGDEVAEITENNTKQNAENGNKEEEPPKRRIIRKPIPKLDSTVLLSENGLVKLQNLIAKTPFKRGKGHEKENLNRLINVYQIWGHNMYPRLKFKSIVERTEKLCSEKRLRIAYMTWKEANKFKRRYETDEYNESGIIRNNNNEEPINLDNDDDNNNSLMEIDIFKPYSMATTANNSTTTSSQSMPTYNPFNNNNNNNNNNNSFASASTSMSASSSTSFPTTNTSFESASTSNPNPNSNNNIPLSKLPHPLTEDERAFLRANRERALKKLREKKEALKRQQELQAQQKEQKDQQNQQDQSSTS